MSTLYKCRQCCSPLNIYDPPIHGSDKLCSSLFFNLPEDSMEGRYDCCSCGAKLGERSMVGGKCSCGKWVEMSVQVHKSKIDVHMK